MDEDIWQSLGIDPARIAELHPWQRVALALLLLEGIDADAVETIDDEDATVAHALAHTRAGLGTIMEALE